MGPERVFPPCEDDDKSPRDGDAVGGAAWSGGEEDQEGEGPTPQEDGGGYSYQPLSQDGDDSGDGNLQHRMEVMGLHLPEAPSPDSDDEDPEGAAAERSRASIPMDAGQDRTMLRFTMSAFQRNTSLFWSVLCLLLNEIQLRTFGDGWQRKFTKVDITSRQRMPSVKLSLAASWKHFNKCY
ncbi:male-enhanced antigen 1 isoform X3 [Phycodurus eques]|uniref:male-enhanced antigen 1 isoform X3 n=1 Tax=Phycodurus eques TaxID=693459 RepID=UPI002ACDBCFF|nr:male-enhanced antigen 1 isoform X3 [Phycodurus eques]